MSKPRRLFFVAATVWGTLAGVDSRRKEAVVGGVSLGSGYLLEAMIFLVPAREAAAEAYAPIPDAGEKRLALIPFVGPLVWWFAARPRIDARAELESASGGCDRAGSGPGCWDNRFDRFFHYALGIPFAVITSGAQIAGAALLVDAALRSDGNESTREPSRPSPKGTLVVAPLGAGISVRGTF